MCDIPPVKWSFSFSKTNIKTILNVKGESEEKDAENILLIMAIQIIDRAYQSFKGRTYVDYLQNHSSNEQCTVSFSLIFPTEREIKEFVKHMLIFF